MKCPECRTDNTPSAKYCSNCSSPLKSAYTKTASSGADHPDTPAELKTGSLFAGRYQIIELLGEGGMGRVYKAYDNEIEEKIALKLIKPDFAAHQKSIQRFRNEIKLARKIIHKNVCRMFDLGESDGIRYITMEYVPGEDLKTTLRRIGKLSVEKAVSAAKKLCQGMAEAHSQGIIHRDLKPGNIMIDTHGDVHIMDFGIAYLKSEKETTVDDRAVGNPYYNSPEQAAGERLDHRTDIYSFGIILYEMLTGILPFEDVTGQSSKSNKKQERPTDPQILNPNVTPELSRLILKCLEWDKKKRYNTADELLKKLETIQTSTWTEADNRTPGTATTKRRFALSRNHILAALLAVLLVVLGVLIFIPLQKNALPLSRIKSLAVMSFRDLNPDKESDHLEAMADALVSKLIRVFPEHRIVRFRHPDIMNLSSDEIIRTGKKLGVDAILEPVFQKEEYSILITCPLIRVRDKAVLKTYSYEGSFDSIFEAQDGISSALAQDLQVDFSPADLVQAKQQEPADSRAYDLYLQGKRAIEKNYLSTAAQEDFDAGVRLYEEALNLDPAYALANCGLGDAYQFRYAFYKNPAHYQLMRLYYEKAFEIAPDLAEANLGMGWAHYFQQDFDSAFESFMNAVELDNKNPTVNFDVGSFFRSIGLYEQAIPFYRASIQQDPSFATRYHLLSVCYAYSGRFEEAADVLDESIRLGFANNNTYFYYARSLLMNNKADEAERFLAKATDISPRMKRLPLQAWSQALKGEREPVLTFLQQEEEIPWFILISLYSLLGKTDEAFESISYGIENGFDEHSELTHTYLFLVNNPCLENLWKDSRIAGIIETERIKYDEMRKKYSRR